jgi:hypothetical protein
VLPIVIAHHHCSIFMHPPSALPFTADLLNTAIHISPTDYQRASRAMRIRKMSRARASIPSWTVWDEDGGASNRTGGRHWFDLGLGFGAMEGRRSGTRACRASKAQLGWSVYQGAKGARRRTMATGAHRRIEASELPPCCFVLSHCLTPRS